MDAKSVKPLLQALAICAALTLGAFGLAYAVTTTPTVQFPTTGWNGYAPSSIQCGELLNANMNSTADQLIPITAPTARYSIEAIEVSNASVSLTTAAGGVYQATSKTTAIVASGQAYSTLTHAAANAAGSTLLLTLASGVTTISFDLSHIYLSLTTAQGAAATADVRVRCHPHYR